MVSISSMIFMAITLFFSVFIPASLIFYLYRKNKISLRIVFIGAVSFFTAVLFLEKTAHILILTKSSAGPWILSNPWMFMLYGGLMAGVFEETARFIIFKYILKDKKEWQDGVAYGLGHGGIESVLLIGMTFLNNIIFSLIINSGNFQKIKLLTEVPSETLESIKHSLIGTPSGYWLAAGVERMLVLGIQIALSILVLYSVRINKMRFVFLAVLMHAVVDFPAALYQRGQTSIVSAEAAVFIAFVVSIFYIQKSKKVFDKTTI